MDALSAIFARRTAHQYDPRPVDRAILDEALAAAIRAPCHKLTWPWRFTHIGPKARAMITTTGVALKRAKNPTLSPDKVRLIETKLARPPVLIVVSQVRNADLARSREDYAACAAAIQNLALALTAHGVSSKWSTGGVTRDPSTYEAAGISPDVEEIIGFVWAGYAAAEVPAIERPPLSEFVRETS